MSDMVTVAQEGSREEILPGSYRNITPQDAAIIQAKTERKMIVAALDNGSLACLPRENGFADTQAATNVVNNTIYHGSSQLILKDFQQRNNFPTAEYCTPDQIEKASNHTGEKIFIKRGSHGITLNFLIDGEQKSVRLFNVAQLQNPEGIKTYAAFVEASRENYLKEKYGENYRPRVTSEAGATITCSSSNPDVYLGEYLAAISTRGKFKVSPEQAVEFSAKAKEFIFTRNEAGHINPFNLSRLGSQASKYCKEFLPEVRENSPQKAPEHERNRSQDPDIGR